MGLSAFSPPTRAHLALSPVFPRQTNALYNDGAWFAVWASWFGLGFLFARYHQALIGTVVGLRWQSAGLAAALTAALYLFSWTGAGGAFIGDYETMTPLFKTLLMALAWTMILALCGFTAKHLNAPSVHCLLAQSQGLSALYRASDRGGGSALYVLPLGLGVWTEYALVLAGTFVGSFLFAIAAEWLSRPERHSGGARTARSALPAGGAETQTVRGA